MPPASNFRKAVWAILAADADVSVEDIVASVGCSDRVVRQYKREWEALRLTKVQQAQLLSGGDGDEDVASGSSSSPSSKSADFSSSEVTSTPGGAGRLHHLERAADRAAFAIAKAAELTAARVGRAGASAKDVGSLRDLTGLLTGALKQLKDARAEDGASVPYVDVLAADSADVLEEMLSDAMMSIALTRAKTVPD